MGNRLAAVGMIIALGATFADRDPHGISIAAQRYPLIAVGVVIGAAIGFFSARMVKMTAMPQMVALFNGAGGGAAALVATAEFLKDFHAIAPLSASDTIPCLLSAIIGALSFSGSIIAFLKLQEVLTGRPITYAGQQFVNALIALAIVAGAGAVIAGQSTRRWRSWSSPLRRFCSGILFVLPIGGADMPVVISLLNAFTGSRWPHEVRAGNNVLIIGGALVGASGTLLTIMMGRAMNRSLANVLFGAFGAGGARCGRPRR